MSIDAQGITAQNDRPLTRADVQNLLQEVGNSNNLNLSYRNMAGIALEGFTLIGANLTGANLTRANLTRANLTGTILAGADLTEVTLTGANLTGASLAGADLKGAILIRASLIGANLTRANLTRANPYRAILTEADLKGAILIRASLIGASLRQADLYRATLTEASLIRAILTEANLTEILDGAILDKATESDNEKSKNTSTFRILIIEEPLTPYNLATIISSLTELSIMYWLISKSRYSDLIEYSQTHSVQFAEEAKLTITKITYNSPFNMDWKIDLSAPSVAEGIITTIDGITQRRAKLEKAELENQVKAQEIRLAQQKAEQEEQLAALEREKKAIEIEKERLALLEQQLELQKKGIEYGLEIAKKTVDLLQPNADEATKGMIIQTILPKILQLQNGKGLTLALPEPEQGP